MSKPNPDYGHGIFRRRIHLRSAGKAVTVELEDNNHGFRLLLHRDDSKVTAVEIDTLRYPFSTCPEAVTVLQQRIAGHPLSGNAQDLRDRVVPGQNCTHMFDMAALAVSHALDDTEFIYDLAVSDEGSSPAILEAHRNDKLIHHWEVREHHIVAPAVLAGKPMMRGFHAWAAPAFDDHPIALEAAIALQRAYFVAQSRRFNFDPPAENPAIGDGIGQGACYSYNHGAVERAVRTSVTIRDFTSNPEKLLRFEP